MKKILIIFLLLASTMQAQNLLFEKEPNYSWAEQLGDSNKFYTDTGDWTLHGSSSITRNADSSLTYSNIPAELNPNPYFDDWSYTDLLSGWDFTSGWAANNGATIDDANSFTTTSSGSIYKSGIFAQYNLRLVRIAGTTTATSVSLRDGSGSNLGPILSGTFDTTFVYYRSSASSAFLLYNVGAGTTDITALELKELIPPDGWTASTMNATNYVIQDDEGLRLVSDAINTNTYISLLGIATIGHQYEIKVVISEDNGGSLKSQTLMTQPITYSSVGTYIDTIIAVSANYSLGRASSSTNMVVSEVSIKEIHDENYISLPVTPTQNQVHELSFDYLKDSNDVKVNYTIANQTNSTNTVTTSYQTATKKFVGGSTDTLKISLSDTGKVKIKNPSIKLRVKQ